MLQTVHAILFQGNLVRSSIVSLSEALVSYIAAVVHDVEHPGIPNDEFPVLSILALICEASC